MNAKQIIIAQLIIIAALLLVLFIQRAINARKYEDLQVELFGERTLRVVEANVNKTIFNHKDQEIIKLKRQLAASEKLRKELSDKRWEEEALA